MFAALLRTSLWSGNSLFWTQLIFLISANKQKQHKENFETPKREPAGEPKSLIGHLKVLRSTEDSPETLVEFEFDCLKMALEDV